MWSSVVCGGLDVLDLSHVGSRRCSNDTFVATGRQRHGDAKHPTRLGQTPGTANYDMRLRIAKAAYRSRYRLRKYVVEPVFGQIKSVLGFQRFSLRGIDKVRHEWGLMCLVSNLRTLLATS